MAVIADPLPATLPLTLGAAPGTLILIEPHGGSRFGAAIFGTARFGGLLGSNALSLTAATQPAGLTLTED